MKKSLAWNGSTCGRLFCAVLLLGVISIRGRRRNLRLVGLLLFVRMPVTFPRTQGARVRLRHATWTDRLAKSLEAILIDCLIKDTRSHPRYVTMHEVGAAKRFVCLA
jgi:hypothetical protein